MSSRLRSQSGPKTSFFAFQDIITCVTGVLILITLILASHLEVNTDTVTQQAPEEQQRRLAELLADQTRLELESSNLREAITIAQAQPDAGKLQEDLAALKVQVADEKQRLEALKEQTASRRQALCANATRRSV